MIDYSKCTKEELIEVIECYANRLIIWQDCHAVIEPSEKEICSLLEEEGLNVKYIESENE